MNADDRFLILDLLARYAWGYDQGQLGVLAACFTSDGTMSFETPDGELTGPIEGREAIEQFMADFQRTQDDQRRHIITNVRFEQAGISSADVVSYLTLASAKENQVTIVSTGWYQDEIINDEGQWWLKNRYLKMDAPLQ